MSIATTTDHISMILKFLNRATPKGQQEEAELLEAVRWLQRLSASRIR